MKVKPIRSYEGDWVYLFRCRCGRRCQAAQAKLPFTCPFCGRRFDLVAAA